MSNKFSNIFVSLLMLSATGYGVFYFHEYMANENQKFAEERQKTQALLAETRKFKQEQNAKLEAIEKDLIETLGPKSQFYYKSNNSKNYSDRSEYSSSYSYSASEYSGYSEAEVDYAGCVTTIGSIVGKGGCYDMVQEYYPDADYTRIEETLYY